jgi:hypothetical protein
MSEKYLLSIYFKDYEHDVFCEPFGLFDTFSEAQYFADEKMDEMKLEIAQEVNLTWEEVEELYEFDFTIKKILI